MVVICYHERFLKIRFSRNRFLEGSGLYVQRLVKFHAKGISKANGHPGGGDLKVVGDG